MSKQLVVASIAASACGAMMLGVLAAAAAGNPGEQPTTPATAASQPSPLEELARLAADASADEASTDGAEEQALDGHPAADSTVDSGQSPASPGYFDSTSGPGHGRSNGSTALGDNEWRPADLAEVTRSVAAFRSSSGLPSFVAPFGTCVVRGYAGTATGMGIPPGQTHGQNLIANSAAALKASPQSGGVMAASFSTAAMTDRNGVSHPHQMVNGQIFECGIPSPAPPSDTWHHEPSPSPSAPPSPTSAPEPEPSPQPSPEG